MYEYKTDKCPDWHKNDGRISAHCLGLAMRGFDNYNPCVRITKDNYREIALYIYNNCRFTDFDKNRDATLRQHYNILRNSIGFVRIYNRACK